MAKIIHCIGSSDCRRFNAKQWIFQDCGTAALCSATLNVHLPKWYTVACLSCFCRSQLWNIRSIWPGLNTWVHNHAFSLVPSVLISQFLWCVIWREALELYIDVSLCASSKHGSPSFVETADKHNIKPAASCRANQREAIGAWHLLKLSVTAQGCDDLAELWHWCVCHIDPLSYLPALRGESDTLVSCCGQTRLLQSGVKLHRFCVCAFGCVQDGFIIIYKKNIFCKIGLNIIFMNNITCICRI